VRKKAYYKGPWVWGLLFDSHRGGKCLYTLYYTEEDDSELLLDTPAIDAKGRFLWCTDVKEIGSIYERVIKKLARLGTKKKVTSCIDFRSALKGLESDEEARELWFETTSLLNIILDYLAFLPNDTEDQTTIKLLGALCDHLFEGKGLSQFYKEYSTSQRHMTQILMYSIYRIFNNSVII
jgi:hypothetical protein